MDNLKIWNKALDAETIQKNVPSFFLEQEMEAIKAEIADVTLENGQSVLSGLRRNSYLEIGNGCGGYR